jgi:hypothetical protein
MTYVEEIDTLEDALPLKDIEWRIAFPTTTDRQRVRSVEPVGLPFTEVEQIGERVASFRFDRLDPNQRPPVRLEGPSRDLRHQVPAHPPPGRGGPTSAPRVWPPLLDRRRRTGHG